MEHNRVLRKSIANTLIFILGFSAVFVILGAGAGTFSMFLNRYRTLVSTVGGAILILFSIQIIGIVNIPFLNMEKKIFLGKKPRGVIGAFVVGVTFASAWTPCIGPILSGILILAATKESMLRGIALLLAYSIGLGLPFLFATIAYGYFISFSGFLKKNFLAIKLASGILLFVLGVFLVLGRFQTFSQLLSVVPELSIIRTDNLSLLIALLAGFVSFVSPCVLPLIPSYLSYVTGVSVLEIRRPEQE
jgi:cytochrome c-type biogenesis protein